MENEPMEDLFSHTERGVNTSIKYQVILKYKINIT